VRFCPFSVGGRLFKMLANTTICLVTKRSMPVSLEGIHTFRFSLFFGFKELSARRGVHESGPCLAVGRYAQTRKSPSKTATFLVRCHDEGVTRRDPRSAIYLPSPTASSAMIQFTISFGLMGFTQ
jgi:hypothetical protein